ncbi:MAG: SIGNAL peptide protein [Flavobacterium sp. BFFFF2]|nr:MAG: SIGNAL peptide protein [Flavobacterium sp. BFFFF2]
MKTLLFTILCIATLQAQTAKADQILGVWLSENKEGKIEIYKTASNTYCGKIVWSKNFYEADGKTLRKDQHNKDESLRSRPIKNMVILTDFVFEDGHWEDGHIYDPKNGKTYSCTIKLEGDALHIRGFIGISLLGRTTIWTRTTK